MILCSSNEYGAFLRVKVALNTREPLPLGVEFLKESGEIDMLPIRIENLGLLYYKYGKI